MKAMVIGGGVAGTVAAIALREAGIDATIHEARERAADGAGAFLTLAVNGLAALRALGLDEIATAAGFATPTMAMRTTTGRHLATFPTGPARPDGRTSRTVRRADLHGALRDEAVRRGVEIRYGARLVDAHEAAGGIVAELADGTTATVDLLVGADGVRSRTREILDPAAPPPRYLGLLDTGGFTRGVPVDTPPGAMAMVYGRRCFSAWVQAPDGEVWWFANPPGGDVPPRAAPTADEWRVRLVDLLADDVGPSAELVRRSHTLVGPWPTHDLPSVPTWHRGRAVLIGDAAHATSPASGQGASMAIEDAVVLAMCLRDAPDVSAALTTYEHVRRPRVERVVAHGKRNGDQKAPGAAGRLVRDAVLRVALPLVARRSATGLAWLHDHRIDWNRPVRPQSRTA